MPDTDAKTECIKVRCTPELKTMVEESADRDGRTASSWVRRQLRQAAKIERRVFGDVTE
jgi:uncharacterized protein (DUF1778 family)